MNLVGLSIFQIGDGQVVCYIANGGDVQIAISVIGADDGRTALLGINGDVLQFVDCACQVDIFACFGFGVLSNRTSFGLFDRLCSFQGQVFCPCQDVARQGHISYTAYIGVLRRNRLAYGEIRGGVDAGGFAALEIAGKVQGTIDRDTYVLESFILIHGAYGQIQAAGFSCCSWRLAVCTSDTSDVDVIFRTEGHGRFVFAAGVQDANAFVGFAFIFFT